MRKSWLAMLPLLLIAGVAQALTVRVGLPSDPSCTAFSIQGAVARLPPGTAMHRILLSSNQTYQTAGLIDSRNVSIEGGYASCSASTPTPRATSQIGPFPEATERLLTLRRTALGPTDYSVSLRNIDVVGPAPGGAILAEGRVDIFLIDSTVRDAGSPALRAGGGILVLNGARIHLRAGSQIRGNRADLGGGIYCSASAVNIESSEVLIAGNVAAQLGGGMFLTQSCNLVWDPDTQSTQGGINGNRAVVGGGIYATNDADIWSTLQGTADGPRRLVANVAEFFGGGIALLADSSLRLSNIQVVSNTAGIVGGPASQGNCGGIYSELSTIRLQQFQIDGNVARRAGGGVCLQRSEFIGEPLDLCIDGGCRSSVNNPAGDFGCTSGACRSSSFNRAGSTGGAYLIGDASTLELDQTRIIGNSAALGSGLYAEDTDASTARTTVRVRNALLVGNNASSAHLLALQNSQFALTSSTIADNLSGSSTLIDLGGSTLDLRASILLDPAGSVLRAPLGTTLSTRCLITQENASLIANGGNATVTAPGFVDAATGNYRLLPQANAADACARLAGDLPLFDISGNPRPVDLPLQNIGGAWDIGAYETPNLITDGLFADGFE